MRYFFRSFLLLFFLCLSVISGFAQQPKLEFSPFAALEKITNSKSTSIIQDSIGYIWIGTEEGLYRYDGQTIYPYQFKSSNPHSIPSNIINKLFIDSRKKMWVSTNEGLCQYNPEYNNFTRIVDQSNLRGVSSTYVTAISEDNKGQIFIASNQNIYKYNPEEKLFIPVVSLTQGRINSLLFDEKNNIWIAASINGGLFYYNQGTSQLEAFLSFQSAVQTSPGSEILDMALLKGNIWIATDGKGIYRYNLQDKKMKQYTFTKNLENYAIHILADRKSDVWICTYGGLKLYNPKDEDFYNYFYEPNNAQSVGGSLWDIYEDNYGNYWTVNSEGGVRIVKRRNKFMHIDSNQREFWHTSNKNTTSVSVDAAGNLWAGYFLNGIDIFKWKEKKTERYSFKNNQPKGLGNGSVFAIFRDSKNQMWVGSYLGGLQKFNPETSDFKSYRNIPGDTLSIAGNDVRSISEDQNGDLWLAIQGKGVDCFNPATQKFEHFNAKNNHLSNDYSFQVLNDSKGNLWVGTSWGLNLLKKGTRLFQNFIYDKNDSTTIDNNSILSISEDQLHQIWVGTSEGLNKFDSITGTFTHYSGGLTNKHIGAILSDRNDNIWVSTNVGISKFDLSTQHFSNYGQSEGLISRDFFDRSCFKNKDGSLYFGGSDGIDYFSPDSLLHENLTPTVVLTDFRILNKSVIWETDSTILKKSIGYAKNIRLNYRENYFSFHYEAVNPFDPEAVTFSYKLDGFDQNWIETSTKREASYTNLNPGKYTFRVRARYDNGEWCKKEATIDITIVPEWWMTLWFKALIVLALIAGSLGIFYFRIKSLRKQRSKLEKLVAERTNELSGKNEQLRSLAQTLAQKNDELKSSNSTKDKLFSIIAHDLRSPFSSILGFQDLLEEQYFELTDEERLEMIGQLSSTSRQTYSLIENLLDWAQIQTRDIRWHPNQFNISDTINEIIDLFQNIASAKKIRIEQQLEKGLTAFADINLFRTTLRNLINNAIKFTPSGGTILLSSREDNQVVTISVIDNGIGMNENQLKSLFKLELTQTKSGTNGERGTGLGLILCKEFVEKNKGTISVESQPGVGSTFSFTVPAKNTTDQSKDTKNGKI